MSYILAMIIGHFVGDYLFQTSKMAANKNKRKLLGWGWAIFHGLVYSFMVVLVMVYFYPELLADFRIILFWGFTWITHALIDHYSFAKHWSIFMASDTLPNFNDDLISKYEYPRTTAEIFKISFTSVVYIVVDNTWHIVLQSVFLIETFGRF